MSQETIDVLDAASAKPAGVRRAEPLLRAVDDVAGDQARHRLSQNQLTILVLQFVTQTLANLVFVYDRRGAIEVSQLQIGRNSHSEINKIVVEKRNSRLERVRHAHLVLDQQNACEKRF